MKKLSKRDPDKEWDVVEDLYSGKSPKRVAWDNGLSLHTVYKIKEDFPLFVTNWNEE